MPFESGKHELIFSHRPAEKNGNVSKAFGRRFVHQVGDLLIERTIQDHAERAIFLVMSGDEQDRAPKIWIEHVRVGHKQ
jgi:hypothetical protein